MRTPTPHNLSCLAVALLALIAWGTPAAFADTTVTLDQPVHFTNAEGSDVVLNAGDYAVEPAEEWLRVTPAEGQAVDSLLLETQARSHEETLTAPLALSAEGETPDTHHLALLLPDGKRLEAIGSYSGLRSRGTLSLLTIQRLRTLSSSSQSNPPTEFSSPLFGGSGGDRTYNLDCGNGSVMVGGVFKAGSWLDALGIICQQVNPQTGALGNEFTRGPFGGSGGTALTSRCGIGKVVVSLYAVTGTYVNFVGAFCKPWNNTSKTASGDSERIIIGKTEGGHLGSSLSDIFVCPSNKVGKAFRGKYGWYIDSARFVCDFWDK